MVVRSCCALSPASVDVYVPYSAGEMQRAAYRGRESARLCLAVPAACGAEPPSGLLHPRSGGCNPAALQDVLLWRGLPELAPPAGASGRPGLATVGSQSHDPSAGP